MARIRSIKPDFWTDEKVVELEPMERLLFIGLWNFADDQGFLDYRPKRIKMQVFPGDNYDVEAGLRILARASLVQFYRATEGLIVHIVGWDKHQRVSNAARERYTLSDLQKCDPDGNPSGGVQSPPEPSRLLGKGREGKGSLLTSPNAAASDDPTPIRDDVDRICRHLAYRIVQNGSKEPTVGKTWHDAARLMLDKDGRTEQFTHQLIDWCQGDQFWRANVLSMPTLREKFDQLRLQMAKENNVRHIARNLDPDAPPMIPLASDDKR